MPQGFGYDYQDADILEPLLVADTITITGVHAFATVTANEPLVREAQDYMTTH